MSKCRTYKCHAACCYNIVLPCGMMERFADKIVTPVIYRSLLPVNPEFPPSEFVNTSFDSKNNKCPFLRKDCKCNIYEDRPDICRRFGDGSHPMLVCEFLKK